MKKISISNNSLDKIKLILEPWADEYYIKSNSKVEIIAAEELDNVIEIEYRKESIVVYGWSDTIGVFENGSLLDPQFE